jgi:hypothetical protein
MTQPKLLDTIAILSPLPYDGLRPTGGHRLIQIEPDKLAIDTDRPDRHRRRNLRQTTDLPD